MLPPREMFDAVTGTLADLATGLRRPTYREALKAELGALPGLGTGTLPWVARSLLGGTLLDAVRRHARKTPNAPALIDDDTRWTWAELEAETSRLAWALAGAGVRRGDVVALLGPNAPAYVAWVLAGTRVGATVALINTHLRGRPLQHAVDAAGARALVVHESLLDPARTLDPCPPRLVYSGPAGEGERSVDELAGAPREPFPPASPPDDADFVYIYTSGTTGLPKPCRISHERALLAGAGFGHAVFAFAPGDLLYAVLPLYHASGLLLGVGACLVTGTPVALRDGFSASRFWPDVRRHGATAILYIGELCRYLVNAAPNEAEKDNPVRIAVGNGLRPDVWEPFQRRFDIAMVREFYAATEAPGFIVNLTGRVGSVGHVPLRRSGWMRLVRFDVEKGEHARDVDGRMIECEPGEVGELLVRLSDKPLTGATEYRGYTDPQATSRKILEGVFRDGDRYFRTGDLLRRDEDDYFYFVDRIGDTYRWKGENVSTAEVADVLTGAPGVREATVVGVPVPGMEGQAGLAALVLEPGAEFDAEAFWRTTQELPAYAQPRFVRLLPALQTTGTFKVQKTALRNEGADPKKVEDPLFVRGDGAYLPLDVARWGEVVGGTHRL